jgi:hypothetical protein
MSCGFLVRLLQQLPEREIYDLYNIPKRHPITPNLARFGSCGEWLAVAKSLGLWMEQRLHGLPPTRSEFPGATSDKPLSDMSLTAVLRRMSRGDITVHALEMLNSSNFINKALERMEGNLKEHGVEARLVQLHPKELEGRVVVADDLPPPVVAAAPAQPVAQPVQLVLLK